MGLVHAFCILGQMRFRAEPGQVTLPLDSSDRAAATGALSK